MLFSTQRRKSPNKPPLPEFARLFPEHEEEDLARISVLPDGRVLPEYLSTRQGQWELGSRDVMMRGGEGIPRCADSVLQEHTYDDTTGSYYFYRKAGVLRWTSHSTTRHKVTRDAPKTCMHSINEEEEESRWHVRSWDNPRWHALSVATTRSRSESTARVITRRDID